MGYQNLLSSIKKRTVIILALVFCFGSIARSDVEVSEDEQISTCVARTGRVFVNQDNGHPFKSSLEDHILAENGCLLNCLISGIPFKFHISENKYCHESEYKCTFGQCFSDSYGKENRAYRTDLVRASIKVISAHVPDKDKTVFNGDSDAFVVVKIYNAGPFYKDGEIIGYTITIQDTNNPEWSTSGIFQPNPISLNSTIKFEIFDSDKPYKPDYLGSVTKTLKELLSDGGMISKHKIYKDEKALEHDYHLELKTVGRKVSPDETNEIQNYDTNWRNWTTSVQF